MNLGVALQFAIRGISANKLRSMLTTLGILIGVAAVIILLAVGTGSSVAVKKSIARLGTLSGILRSPSMSSDTTKRRVGMASPVRARNAARTMVGRATSPKVPRWGRPEAP